MFPGYPIFCILSTLLTIITIPANYRAGNLSIIAIGVWTIGGNIIAAANTIIWHGNIRNPNPIWGDICQAYFCVMSLGISSPTLYIQYTFWRVAKSRKLWITPRERQWQKFWAYFWGYAIPLLFAVLHYISQGRRYIVIEDLGPAPTTSLTPLAFALYYIWDPIFCIIAFGFSIATYITIRRHRKEVANTFASSKKHSVNQYYRLLLLTAVLVFIHFPFVFWVVVVNAVDYTVYPWISWDVTHSNYMEIVYIPRSTVEKSHRMVQAWSVSYWAVGLTGYLYFVCYGTGNESLKGYKSAILCVLGRLGIKFKPSTKTISPSEQDDKAKKRWNIPFFARRTQITSVGQTGTATLVPSEGLGDKHKHSSGDLKGDDSVEKLSHNQTHEHDQDVTVFSPTSMETTHVENKGKENYGKGKDLEAQKEKWGVDTPTAEETEEVGF